MNLRTFDGKKLSQLYVIKDRLMEDAANPHRPYVNGIYLMTHGETYDLRIMGFAIGSPLNFKIMYCGEPPASSVRGGNFWREKLSSLCDNELVPVMGARYQDKSGEWRINSFSEARPAIEKALELGMDSIEVVALSFHITRCFIGFATECLAMDTKLNVFARVTGPISWTGAAIHSQGTQTGTAVDFAEDEIDKILSYTNLAAPSEVLRYMNERDARVSSIRYRC